MNNATCLLYNSNMTYPVKPIWKNENRYRILNTKRPQIAPKTSMDWRK